MYGVCGTFRCTRSEFERCRKLLNDDYKFYLSFENSNCDYYITEKFYENGLGSADTTVPLQLCSILAVPMHLQFIIIIIIIIIIVNIFNVA